MNEQSYYELLVPQLLQTNHEIPLKDRPQQLKLQKQGQGTSRIQEELLVGSHGDGKLNISELPEEK